jgi:hypothetical protein
MNWQYSARLAHWEATHGDWRAVVRLPRDSTGWHPYIERIYPPHDRRDGPIVPFSLEGRAWCEAQLQQLQLGER